ncbi:MAG: ATP-binding protein, partial [Saprospiraceae bacterium]|nr:ATP-binding protein [Saprospiraceae bacterium]
FKPDLMRKILFLFLINLISPLSAQNPIFIEPDEEQADSLRRILIDSPNDTLIMASCRGLALYYLDVNNDSSRYYSGRALYLARKLRLRLWEVDALDLNAIGLHRSGDYSKSLEGFLAALKLGSDPKAHTEVWSISAFTPSGDPTYARYSMLGTVYLDLANLYFETKFYHRSIDTFRKSLQLAAQIEDHTIPSIVYSSMADAFIALNKLDSAEILIKRAMLYGDSANYVKYRGNDYWRLGMIRDKQGSRREAKAFYFKGVEWSKEQKNLINVGENYYRLAKSYYGEGALDSSRFFARKALAAHKNTYHRSNILNSYSQVYEVFAALGEPDSALFYLEKFKRLNDSLSVEDEIKQFQNVGFEEQLQVIELEAAEQNLKNRLRMNTLLGSSFTLILIGIFLYRNGRNKQKAKQKIETAYSELKNTQAQLIQSEKMASLGELTAGIAHEIQNPLNFVNNFSEVNTELLEELREEIEKGQYDQVAEIATNIISNEEKIHHHGRRADSIVKSMLQHSRSSDGKRTNVGINSFLDEYLRLAYHGMRAKDKSFNASIETDFDKNAGTVTMIPQEIGRVILNLLTNAFYAVAEKQKLDSEAFNPVVAVSTKKSNRSVFIKIRDNGPGIPREVSEKIFQPFFTTKPTGEGTGLGLSLSYDIIKSHDGELTVDSKEGEYAEFTIQLPN